MDTAIWAHYLHILKVKMCHETWSQVDKKGQTEKSFSQVCGLFLLFSQMFLKKFEFTS